jgi:hypothetical protein
MDVAAVHANAAKGEGRFDQPKAIENLSKAWLARLRDIYGRPKAYQTM